MAKRKQSAAEKEYSKQRRRLKQAIARSEKQGYIFPENILPEKPKRITKASVRRLAKITPESLRQKAEFLIEETGELIPVKGNKAIIKQEITRKRNEYKEYLQQIEQDEEEYFPSFSSIVIQEIKSYILGFPPSISEMLMPLINTLIEEVGENEVATALENMPQQFHEYLYRHPYDSNSAISEFASSLIEYLPDTSIQYKKDLMDRFEFNELGYTVEDEET